MTNYTAPAGISFGPTARRNRRRPEQSRRNNLMSAPAELVALTVAGLELHLIAYWMSIGADRIEACVA